MYAPEDIIGPYRLIRKLGTGVFGTVWLAEKKTEIIRTQVALKLPNHLNINMESLRREAELWSLASGHPNILPILDAAVHQDQICIDSEYAPDGTLSNWLSGHGGRVSDPAQAIAIGRGILAGLIHLKSKNLVHRDLKPTNILMNGDIPRIADFGLARVLDDPTSSQIAAGTPLYMAPEAFDGDRHVEGDLWAVGVILYELTAGKLPFFDSSTLALRGLIALGRYDSLPSTTPPTLTAAINGALQPDPAKRFHSGEEMLAALEGRPKHVKATVSRAEVNGPILVDLLMALTRELQKGSVDHRKRAAEHIGRLEKDAVLLIPLLATRLNNDQSPVVREAIRHSLRRIGTPEAETVISTRDD